MFRTLRLKYPVAEIVVFFDFLSLTQPPWKVGQAERTPEEQHNFSQAIMHMHFCYCYSDAIIHIHVDAPPEDMDVHVTKKDMSKLTLKQLGSLIQVTGLEDADTHDSSSASIFLFDEIQMRGIPHGNTSSWMSGIRGCRLRKRACGRYYRNCGRGPGPGAHGLSNRTKRK